MESYRCFTLKEVQKALEEEGKVIPYRTLYSRLQRLKKSGAVPKDTLPGSLSYDIILAIVRARSATRQTVRDKTVKALRVALRNDGVF